MQESGTNVTIRAVREATRGTTPAAVGTPVTNIAAATGGSGTSDFTRASGSFVTDGFVAGQRVRTTGFAASPNNSDWLVKTVTALTLTVEDPSDVIATEAAEVGQEIRILLSELRTTSRAVNPRKGTLETAEVRTDRQKSDVRHGFQSVEGRPGFELSLNSFDDFLEGLLGGAWETVTAVSGINIGINTSTKKIDRASGSFITDGYRPGDIVRTTGFANGVNNADWQVLVVTALELTVSDPDGVIITEAAAGGRTVTYPGKRLDVGAVLRTYTVERVFSGIGKYQPFKGVTLNGMGLSVQPEQIVGGSFDLLGMIFAALSSTPLSSVSAYPRPVTSPFSAFDGRMYEGGSLISVVTGLDMQMSNNRRLQAVVGRKTSPDVYEGQFVCTGELTALFEDETMLNKFINETESSMYCKLADVAAPTSFMSIVFPRVKYQGGDMDPPPEGPVPLVMPFQALVKESLAVAGGTTRSSTVTIQRSNTP